MIQSLEFGSVTLVVITIFRGSIVAAILREYSSYLAINEAVYFNNN